MPEQPASLIALELMTPEPGSRHPLDAVVLREAGIESFFGVNLDRIENFNNNRGYELMSAGQLDAALEVFKLNTLISPDSANAWDSLAECYLNMKRYDSSRKYYEKSLELNPENDNARRMLERLRRIGLD